MKTLELETRGAVATLRLNKERGNAIDAVLLDDLVAAAHDLAENPAVRAVRLASAHPKLFSPGLDLQSLVDYDRPAMERFMLRFAEAMWALYALPKPVLASVNGHAVAGGCILALTADYRILVRRAQLGLNEVKIGVPLPWSVTLLLRGVASPSFLTRAALLGRNFSDETALAAGLADEVVEPENFESACATRLEELAEKDAEAVRLTKAYLRQATLAEMRAGEKQHVGEFLDGWFAPATQERIRATVQSLQAKR